MLVNRLSLIVVGILTTVALTGCGGTDGPDLLPVTGTITKGGAPLVGAELEFYPEGDGAASYGKSDEQGNFTLRYSTGQPGAKVGDHKVTVLGGTTKGGAAPSSDGGMETLTEGDTAAAPLANPEASGRRGGGKPKPTVGIPVTIKAGEENHVTIELD